MVAVGADRHHARTVTAAAIAPGIKETRLDDDFLFRVALRAVETGRGLGQAEDIAYAVIADAIARTEIAVGRVVEGTPRDAAGVTVVGSQLFVDAHVPDHVFGHMVHVVEALGGEHVAVEFGVEILRMIGGPQGKAEIVHGEDVFQQLGVVAVADAARLARIVERVGHFVGTRVEIVVVRRFVDADTPEHDRGMVPVAPDHAVRVIHGEILPGPVPDVLPAWNLFEHQ